MDIAALSMSMSQSNLMQDVSIGVLKMAKDSAQQQGQMLTQMIERSVTPNLGGNLDIRV
ncbi:putative motility protein YjfB-like [Paenibacillus taihuensis]|uniref:Putative motility protein YjfB-like n=1 Tax=Paenibacillus taihuensis TaxID=1156355 RepID=A0A3D9R2J3_9BACL|nr:YjfB family protein [Paenibacillus taihuensis]REE66641.1 putative motility protein YjfB-like [Paenibacillus taihuensis]